MCLRHDLPEHRSPKSDIVNQPLCWNLLSSSGPMKGYSGVILHVYIIFMHQYFSSVFIDVNNDNQLLWLQKRYKEIEN